MLIESGDVPCTFFSKPRLARELIFTDVRVRDKMPDIRDIHDVPNAKAVYNQSTIQHILRDKRSIISDMLGSIDSRAASVERYRFFLLRRKTLFFSRESVEKNYTHLFFLK